MIPQGPLEGDHMANGRVEMAVREVTRQCRTLKVSFEHNTGVRIANDSPLLSWLLRFAAQVMNKMRIGKGGKTSELRRTGQRWIKPMAQFGEKGWFRKIGEEGVSSFASRMTLGIFVGHHDRTRAISYITKIEIVRGKSQTKQTLSDAWESTNWKVLCQGSHVVVTETRVTKKFITDEEETERQELWTKILQRLSVEDPTCCLRMLKLTDTSEVVRETRCLHRMGKRQNHVRMNSESESERLLREP